MSWTVGLGWPYRLLYWLLARRDTAHVPDRTILRHEADADGHGAGAVPGARPEADTGASTTAATGPGA